MALETKVILIAIGEIIRSNKSRRKIYEAVARMAGADGVALEPFEDDDE